MITSVYAATREAEALIRKASVSPSLAEEVASLRNRLEKKHITVAVMGQFKRGKTSLVNAILEKPLLPVGIIPVTASVTQITYGEERVTVFFKDGTSEEITPVQLSRYISEQENPGNERGVSLVTIQTPCEILKKGITLVDTPGVGSLHKHNSDTTYSFVHKSDAIIFMLSVDSPINEIEATFLEKAKNWASKFYFTVNKIDLITAEERTVYMQYCKNFLCKIMGVSQVALHSISTKSGEGLPELLEQIRRDCDGAGEEILEESVRIKLLGTVDAAISQVHLYCRALELPLESLDRKRQELAKQLEKLTSMRRRSSLELSQQAEELIKEISQTFENQSQALIDAITLSLSIIYQEKLREKPRELQAFLCHTFETELHAKLREMNEGGLLILKKGYEEMANNLSEQMTEMKAYLSSCVSTLFGIEYHYESTEYTLSERSDFYIRISQPDLSLFPNKLQVQLLLPRRYANRCLYNHFLGEVGKDVSRNLTSMIADYRYKIRESTRSFRTSFQEEADNLQKELDITFNRVLEERKDNATKIEEQISELYSAAAKLEELGAMLKAPR